MNNIKTFLTSVISPAVVLLIAGSLSGQIVVFSNDFEDGDLNAEIGTQTIFNSPAGETGVYGMEGGGSDPTLGSMIGLIDQTATQPLAMDWTFSDANNTYECLDLTDGNTVTLSFDVAARRTNGAAKTTFIDAIDIDGNIVSRFVLGDANAFGNGGTDRQRPGQETIANGATAFADDFYWGADTGTGNGFNAIRDAHFDLTFSSTGWDLAGIRQTGAADLNQTGLATYDGLTHTTIAKFSVSSFGANYGLYWDNIEVSATNPVTNGDSHIPEPGSAAVLALIGLGIAGRRNRG